MSKLFRNVSFIASLGVSPIRVFNWWQPGALPWSAAPRFVRAFIRVRIILATHEELARKFAQHEKRIEAHDEEIIHLFDAIRELMEPSASSAKRIGFHV